MSANTETQLEMELQAKGGPNDAVVDDTSAVAFAVLESANGKKTTLNLPVVSTKILTPPWMTLQTNSALQQHLQWAERSSNASSTTIQQWLSFDEPPAPSTNHILAADYVHDGTRERPTPVYFNQLRPSHHMGLFIHQAEISSGHQVIKTTIVQKSGAIGDINNVHLEMAQSVPKCFKSYVGRALLFCEMATECFGWNISAFLDTSTTNPAKHQTATELKKAQVSATKGKNAWTFKLILFPPTQEPAIQQSRLLN
eukprot:scaffold2845_cov50-Cylindrotheca_fusiformis.AAC.1